MELRLGPGPEDRDRWSRPKSVQASLAHLRRNVMSTKSFVGAFIGSPLRGTALPPARAADVTSERMLNPQREPQNWILHHGNYQGHRFSLLKEINADTVKNMKPVFTVALSGFQSGGATRSRD